MANEVLQKVGTQIAFYVTGSYSPADTGTDYKEGTPTEAVLTQASLANTAARQSDKVDLGATRARAYEVLAAVDFTGEVPVAGEHVDYYWFPSTSGTQSKGNIAGNSGADAAAPGGALGSITLAEFLKLGIFIGSLIVHDGAVVQNGFIGVLVPPSRYGQMVVVNEADDVFEADDVEMGVFMNPIVDEVQ